jgi:hypothetical protein
MVNEQWKRVEVRGVRTLGREAVVFNLVLGDTLSFLANDFVVRSKPPVEAGKR